MLMLWEHSVYAGLLGCEKAFVGQTCCKALEVLNKSNADGQDNSLRNVLLQLLKWLDIPTFMSAASTNSTIVIFLDNVKKVHDIVVKGIVVNSVFNLVTPLVHPAKKITLSNVPAFIRDDIIERELTRHGRIVLKFEKSH